MATDHSHDLADKLPASITAAIDSTYIEADCSAKELQSIREEMAKLEAERAIFREEMRNVASGIAQLNDCMSVQSELSMRVSCPPAARRQLSRRASVHEADC
mmetsp:Transcript_32473/g.65622  ORF Transcript_32473/g.65622 Transcript_32473/m.65622 type:complete len:102 (-) Transcript_32473:348-653(-)